MYSGVNWSNTLDLRPPVPVRLVRRRGEATADSMVGVAVTAVAVDAFFRRLVRVAAMAALVRDMSWLPDRLWTAPSDDEDDGWRGNAAKDVMYGDSGEGANASETVMEVAITAVMATTATKALGDQSASLRLLHLDLLLFSLLLTTARLRRCCGCEVLSSPSQHR